MKFWAYRHQSGHIHLKRYWEDRASKDAVLDAYDSPFVDDVAEPFEAKDRQDAERIAREKLALPA